MFKSLQVIFAVLIVHFFLKMTGKFGRNAMIAVSFVLALVMVGGLGYLVAYNNMAGATSATLDQASRVGERQRQFHRRAAGLGETGFGHPGRARRGERFFARPAAHFHRLARQCDSWFWLAFASVIFFIVTTVAALYMQDGRKQCAQFPTSRATIITASGSSPSSTFFKLPTSSRKNRS